MKRRLEGEKPQGGRPLKNSSSFDEFWTQDKTAKDLNISHILAISLFASPALLKGKAGIIVGQLEYLSY